MSDVFAVNTGRNSRGSGLQSFRPPAQPIASIAANITAITRSVSFLVPIPDPRLRTRVDISFVPNPGTDPQSGLAGRATIWIYEANQDEQSSGQIIPATNLDGTTKATPLAIPVSDGLFGYSREFWSAADYIAGVVAVTNGPAIAGTWSLQCRCSPDAVRFTDEEWQEVTARFSPRVQGWQSF